MRTRNVVCAAAIVVLGFCGAASAGLIVYDNFPGPTLNMANWQLQDAGKPTANNNLLTLSGSGWEEINSSASWNALTTTFELEYAGGSGSQFFGISNYPGPTGQGTGSVIVRSDSGGAGNWSLFSDLGGPQFAAFTAPVAGDIYDFSYNSSTGHANLYKDGGTTPIASLAVSASAFMNPGNAVYMYYGTNSGELQSTYCGTYSNVPEPSTIVLLTAGLVSLLAYAWRKRR